MIRRATYISFSHVLSILLLAITLTVTAGQTYVLVDTPSQEISEDSSSESEEQATLQISAAVQSTFHINLGFDSFLLEEIISHEISTITPYTVDQFIPSISKSFKILLRRIISTNAP